VSAPGFPPGWALIQIKQAHGNHRAVAAGCPSGERIEPSTQAIRGRGEPVIHLPLENKPPPGQPAPAGRAWGKARSIGPARSAQLVFERLAWDRAIARSFHARDVCRSSWPCASARAGEGLVALQMGADQEEGWPAPLTS